jgi:hypothetical protein
MNIIDSYKKLHARSFLLISPQLEYSSSVSIVKDVNIAGVTMLIWSNII